MNMEKKTESAMIRESLDKLDEFKFARSDPMDFGKKTQPSDQEVDDASSRRLGDVTARANDEKKGFGFFRKLRDKAFGKKKAPEAEPFQRQEQSPEERRAAVIARAKSQD